jgi:hypothetical protein
MVKRILPFLFLIIGMPSSIAQGSLPAQLSACLEIPGVLQRLACYDRVAHGMGQVAAPRSALAEKPVARGAPQVGLGSERLPQIASAVPRRAQEMTAEVTGVSYDLRGRFTITLSNGQIWRQLEGDTAVLRRSRISAVRISRGALGSYDLNVAGLNASYRVVRLQ